ncbi:MAG: carbamate kinase [Pseudomonadota bacterium]
MSENNKHTPLVVVALGGHAFMGKGEKATCEVYEKNADLICKQLMVLIERGYNIVITHGNGPQVGNLLLKNEISRDQVEPMPLDVLVADTEGSLGYTLQQAMLNNLIERKLKRYVVTFITQVLVNKDDPSFQNPTKPVGPFITKEDAEKRKAELGWDVAEDAGKRGWRRVVASPKPIKVIQHKSIKESAMEGHVVIAGGGGGIPIIKNQEGKFAGVEAVVDKDSTSSIIAQKVKADLLIILTEVPNVYLNFKKENETALSAITLEETRRLIEAGHFPAGSMGPKVEAIYEFLLAGGKRGLITAPECLGEALDGKTGTHFIGKI